MTKLPSYLKGLVESRAHSASDIERLEQLRTLIDEELIAARKRLDSADVLIRECHPTARKEGPRRTGSSERVCSGSLLGLCLSCAGLRHFLAQLGLQCAHGLQVLVERDGATLVAQEGLSGRLLVEPQDEVLALR